uniref:ATP synthase F0 subunit 8 n=1 Tax=Eulepethus nanhaiensis TaxID=1881687 RepID=A0A343W6F7_9ANNE|nr:ATP synthase F0 subunit 8 [Eulepethus nanhaiensis]
MPHLSPLNWILTPLMFWLLLSLLSSILWWSQTPSFPPLPTSFSPIKEHTWKWS